MTIAASAFRRHATRPVSLHRGRHVSHVHESRVIPCASHASAADERVSFRSTSVSTVRTEVGFRSYRVFGGALDSRTHPTPQICIALLSGLFLFPSIHPPFDGVHFVRVDRHPLAEANGATANISETRVGPGVYVCLPNWEFGVSLSSVSFSVLERESGPEKKCEILDESFQKISMNRASLLRDLTKFLEKEGQ